MSYEVKVYRDEAGYWIADAPAVRGAHSQSKRLDQIEPNIREAIAVMLEVDPEHVSIDLRITLAPELDRRLSELREQREAAELAAHKASEASRAVARSLVEEGLSLRDAGQLLGLSHQRVGQLVKH